VTVLDRFASHLRIAGQRVPRAGGVGGRWPTARANTADRPPGLTFSTATEDGSRQPLCEPGPDGRRQGFPLAGRGRAVYNACVRLVRADYCGGVQQSDRDPLQEFEAGWTAAGAVCVRHVRVKENISLERLAASCPRLRDRLGETCTEQRARTDDSRLQGALPRADVHWTRPKPPQWTLSRHSVRPTAKQTGIFACCRIYPAPPVAGVPECTPIAWPAVE
jgi:ADYC domain